MKRQSVKATSANPAYAASAAMFKISLVLIVVFGVLAVIS